MDEYAGKVQLKACRHCSRTFVPESLAKHEPNCMKNSKTKRKVFDTSKQRVTEDLSLRDIKKAQKKDVKPKTSHWKQKHEEFIRNIRAAKIDTKAVERGEPLPPPPPPSENPDYITCQYCNRRFNEKAADRHISFCKEQQKRLPLKAKREPTAQEKARAAATKYQPPKPKVRGQVDSPSYSDGYSKGGYSNTPPGGRGGGYSNTPPGGRGGGYSNAPPGRAGARQEPNRAPAGGTGYGGRGRAGSVGGAATRGRPSPSQPAYTASDYADYDSHSDFDPDELLHGNGRALRTGRDVHAYEEARRDVRGHNPVPRTKATRGGMGASRLTATKTSGPMGRAVDSGYYSNNSEGDGSTHNKLSRGNTIPKFCHECGNKYPVEEAKFCCECGIRRMGVTVR